LIEYQGKYKEVILSKILTYDIECSDLMGDWGTLICVGYKWIGDKTPTVLSILDYPGKDVLDDSNLVKAFYNVISEADMVITFFGKGFDQPWMNHKYLENNLPALPNFPHADLFFTAKSLVKVSRKSLDNLVTLYSLGKKYNVSRRNWRLAKAGVPEGIREVMKHCYVDVNLTEKLYFKFRPWIRQHPRISTYDACAACGSKKLQRRGRALSTTKGPRQRVQCQGCGHWSLRPWDEVLPGEVG
jgi:uncharacterized protein YprB with RNaseH-like and TPR domain